MLLDMWAENFPQRRMKQMCGGMISRGIGS
jgi:hypothetical protein